MKQHMIKAHDSGQGFCEIAKAHNTTEETVKAMVTRYLGFMRLPDKFPECDDMAISSKISEHIEHLRFETEIQIIDVKTAIVGMLRSELNARATKKQTIWTNWIAAISISIAAISLVVSLCSK